MGHLTEIFSSPPPDRDICAICHDVLKNAVSMKECGHTFCETCADACIQTRTCPNCRVAVTGTNPCFHARESIESMNVICPNGNSDQGTVQANSRRRGNDGEIVQDERCNWKGHLKDLENHEESCAFKIISCAVDGCNHLCRRKDMDAHLSGGGLLYHIGLMKQSHEAQIQTMNVKLRAEMNRKGREMQQKMGELKEEMKQKINRKETEMQQEMEEVKEEMKQKMEELDQKWQDKTSKLKETEKKEKTKLKKKIEVMDKKMSEMQKEIDELKSDKTCQGTSAERFREPFEVINLDPTKDAPLLELRILRSLVSNFEFFYPSDATCAKAVSSLGKKDNRLGLRCIHCKDLPDCYVETEFPEGITSIAKFVVGYCAPHYFLCK